MHLIRSLLLAALAVFGLGCASVPGREASWLTSEQLAADFDALDRFVRESYAFLDLKRTDWSRVVAELRPRALAASDETEWMHVLEDALDQLYDAHCMLNRNAPDSWRPAPHGLWVELRDGRTIVTAVERGSGAAAVGARPGDEVLAIDSTPFADLVRRRAPRFLRAPDPAAEEWARASAAAGQHGAPLSLQVRRSDGIQETLAPAAGEGERPLVEWSLLPGNVGRIALASFAEPEAVEAFDRALEALRDTRGLLLDVRSNSGGNTAVARPILGRFLAERMQYAWMARRAGETLGPRWPEYVEPRGPWTYTAPVVVIVDRFSVSMAEGFAMGLRGMGRARIVGTPMARLGAAIGRLELPNCGITVQISTEPVYAVDGTPRWELEPDILVDPVVDPSLGDPFERAARAALGF